MKIKVMFFGTPEIAKMVLETIYTLDNIEVVGVVSQPDSEYDRKKNVVFSAVKSFCLEHNLKLFQPFKISEIKEEIALINPDIIITCAYGQFIPQSIIDIPKYKIVNVHASLLPKFRGGAPIHYAIMNNEKETGITLMHTIKKMDAGNILFQDKIEITETTTTHELTHQLALLAQKMIKQHFFKLLDINLIGYEQEESKVSFAYNIQKNQNVINFNQSAHLINRFVNAMNNKPVAVFEINNQLVKVYKISITNNKSIYEPGTILLNKHQVLIATTDFDINLELIQLPNKKVLSTKDVLNGNHPFKNLDRIGAKNEF